MPRYSELQGRAPGNSKCQTRRAWRGTWPLRWGTYFNQRQTRLGLCEPRTSRPEKETGTMNGSFAGYPAVRNDRGRSRLEILISLVLFSCRLFSRDRSQYDRLSPPQAGQDRCFEGTFNPQAQVQFGEGAFPEFSQSLPLNNRFRGRGQPARHSLARRRDDEDGLPRRSLRRREYEMPNSKREAPGENARKRSWKR
jgi:hypothetical protein